MISITVYRTGEGDITAFTCKGHAGYDESGRDIVCAAVSMLVINTINSIELYGNQKFNVYEDEKNGVINFSLDSIPASPETELLLNSMILGLKNVEKEFHDNYMKLNFKEV